MVLSWWRGFKEANLVSWLRQMVDWWIKPTGWLVHGLMNLEAQPLRTQLFSWCPQGVPVVLGLAG